MRTPLHLCTKIIACLIVQSVTIIIIAIISNKEEAENKIELLSYPTLMRIIEEEVELIIIMIVMLVGGREDRLLWKTKKICKDSEVRI